MDINAPAKAATVQPTSPSDRMTVGPKLLSRFSTSMAPGYRRSAKG
jgi:hypothetical protein